MIKVFFRGMLWALVAAAGVYIAQVEISFTAWLILAVILGAGFALADNFVEWVWKEVEHERHR